MTKARDFKFRKIVGHMKCWPLEDIQPRESGVVMVT